MNKGQAISEFKETWIITDEIRSVLRPLGVMNWIWPWNISRWGNYLLQELKTLIIKDWLPEFEADWDYHDLGYYIGWTEKDRLKIDIWFFERLFDDILQMGLPAYKEIYYLTLAYISYRMVKKYWKKHFNYKLT